VVHAATNGLIAAVAVLVLLRVGLLASSSGLRFPRASFALVTTVIGVTSPIPAIEPGASSRYLRLSSPITVSGNGAASPLTDASSVAEVFADPIAGNAVTARGRGGLPANALVTVNGLLQSQ
jgi:hypothetical protein